MWGSVETTVKLGLTGLAGFTLACVVIETAGTFIGTAVAGSSNGQNYFVARCVEIKFYGAFVLILRVNLHAIDATPARWRGDAGSSPLDRARTAASSPRNDLVKNYRVHPTNWLISTQVLRGSSSQPLLLQTRLRRPRPRRRALRYVGSQDSQPSHSPSRSARGIGHRSLGLRVRRGRRGVTCPFRFRRHRLRLNVNMYT